MFHISNVWSRRSIGKKIDFLIPWNLKFKEILIRKLKKIKLYSIRALKRYLSWSSLMYGRETVAISKFSALNQIPNKRLWFQNYRN